ncbi:cytochrome P450 [Tenggerimyces flavus]|uniref:Cytochrome P450 n=1 Tax=Tenggerimyces flavus TaxID=1708749 RepID=A0ABV7YLV1_9ACTN|nr:cytochrome P450 [Tenggerimyces flavus]MBM7786562.1 pentalenolactone synthase [Tenggerimyces flavus]
METGVRRVATYVGDPAWEVRGYDLVREMLSDPRLGRTHPRPETASRLSDSVIFGRPQPATPTEHEDHVKMRRVLGRSFSARRLAALRPRVQTIVDDQLEQLLRREPPTDFHAAVSFPLPALVICELLGVPYDDRDDFKGWSEDAAHMSDEQRSMTGLANLWQYMHQLLQDKQRAPAEDVLSDLATEYPIDEAAKLAAGLLFAGHETTVTTIDKGMVLLLSDPAQRSALEREPAQVASFVEEILRSPFPVRPDIPQGTGGLPRYAKEDLPDIPTAEGASIRAGDLLLLDLQGANLDPGPFAEPDSFDPTRSPNPHVTFGHGPYFCIGAPLARIELQALFGTVFGRVPTLALDVPVEELQPRSHLLTGGLAALPVRW